MNITLLYKKLLSSQKEPSSKATVKNYLSDIRQFIKWYEKNYYTSCELHKINNEVIKNFIKNSNEAKSTQKRRIASIKKLFDLLEKQGYSHNPTNFINNTQAKNQIDEWKINEFKSYLFEQKAKKNTIINYESDILAFKKWTETVLKSKSNLLNKITSNHIEEYKNRHKYILNSSPSTLKRKLASIKKYFQFLYEKGYLVQNVQTPKNNLDQISLSELKNTSFTSEKVKSPQYAPIRLLRSFTKPYFILEEKIADRIVKVINN